MKVVSQPNSLRVTLLGLAVLGIVIGYPWTLVAQAPTPSNVRFAAINPIDMREWLTYLASDALQGRQVFTEGYGLAAAFVADRLRDFGVRPMGDIGYFQTVKRRGYRVTRNSSVTVDVNGQSRTFKHGDHVTFSNNSGGKQTLTFNGVEFAGYGIVSQQYNLNDFANRDVRGKLVTYLNGTPATVMQQIAATQQAGGGRGGRGGGLGGNRTNYAMQTLGAAAVMTFAAAPAPPSQAELALVKAQEALNQANQAVADALAASRGRGGRGGFPQGGGGGRGAQTAVVPDLNTVYRVDGIVPPAFTADETFFEFLFSGSPTKFADLRAKAEKGETLAPFTIANAKVTVTIDNTFDVVSTELTKNVVGMIEGSDSKLKDTYVLFGAHLDHVGYRTSAAGGRGGRGGGGAGAQANPTEPDLIFNGADDDGSGSTALLGIAKAFANGPKPKRSVIFVWHAGEEAGLLGSHYMADFPVVPLEKVQAQFNIDMIGRNRNDDPAQGNTVFVIGADRISTDLHNLVVDTNATLAKPLTLDYEYNDPSDPNSFYTRSDHYSYAIKGIPIAFFFTGTHPDYHGAGDHADKILYPKLTQIAQLVYQAGFNTANSERVLERDNKGPRAGRGTTGRIEK